LLKEADAEMAFISEPCQADGKRDGTDEHGKPQRYFFDAEGGRSPAPFSLLTGWLGFEVSFKRSGLRKCHQRRESTLPQRKKDHNNGKVLCARAVPLRWGLERDLWALERERIGHEETSRNLKSFIPILLHYATLTKSTATGLLPPPHEYTYNVYHPIATPYSCIRRNF
jgi:hypothetical protein